MNQPASKGYRVVIVGGGGTGAALAHDLALRGFHVCLFERGELTSGTTGRHHGLLHSGARYAVYDRQIAARCMRENSILRRLAGDCIEANGGLFVSLHGDDPHYEEQFMEGCLAAKIPTRAVDGAEARRYEPNLSADINRAVVVPDASFDAMRLPLRFFATAVANGALVQNFTSVTAIETSGGTVVAVITRRADGREQRIKCDMVINAAGVWGGLVAAMAGASVDVSPQPGSMLAVKGRLVNMVINRLGPPSGGDIILPKRRLTIVGATQWAGNDLELSTAPAQDIQQVRASGTVLLPQFGKSKTHAAWAACRPLYGTTGGQGFQMSRNYHCLDHAQTDGIEGLISITGGKATVIRAMAESAADLICHKMGVDAPCCTETEPLRSHRDYWRNTSPPQPTPRKYHTLTASVHQHQQPTATASVHQHQQPTTTASVHQHQQPTTTASVHQHQQPTTTITIAIGGESYELPRRDGTTVLDALEWLRSHHHPDLLYRHSCHHGSCGTCSMLVNGEKRLACLTALSDLPTDEPIELSPLPMYDLVGDLAITPHRLFRDFPAESTYLRDVGQNSNSGTPPPEAENWQRLEDCIECGLCLPSCPVADKFMGPAALAAYNRERINRPAREKEILTAVSQDNGVGMCVRALNCSRVCPTGVAPAKQIFELRQRLDQA